MLRIEKQTIDDRLAFVRNLRVCFGCLKPSNATHYGKMCTTRLKCDLCGGAHPTILHRGRERWPEKMEKKLDSKEGDQQKKDADGIKTQEENGSSSKVGSRAIALYNRMAMNVSHYV